MKVLIVKAGALGDVVHALPVLAWLQSDNDKVEIDWLVEEAFVPLLEGHPMLRRVLCLQTKSWRRSGWLAAVRGAWQIICALRKEQYDLVLDLQGNSKSGLFTLFSGAPIRYGFARDGVREWPNLLATNRKVPLKADEFHITDRALAIAKAACPGGSSHITAGPLVVDTMEAEGVEGQLVDLRLADGPVVVLHYGTTWVTKLWPLSSWQQLAARLVNDRGLRPVLTWGSPDERVAVNAIQDACQGRCVVWPRGNLKQLCALLARADLVVGGDTGPVHIAAAVATPTISLFRVTDASRNAPRGKQHLSLSAEMNCAPCLRKECDRDLECGLSIPVEKVYASIIDLLSRSVIKARK